MSPHFLRISYGLTSTPASIAASLAANASASAPVYVSAVSDALYLTSTGKGSSTDSITYSVVNSGFDSADFGQPSFPYAPISGTLNGDLSGGSNGGTNSSATVYSYTVPSGGYDGVGNLLAYTDSVMGQWSYTYDSLNRVVSGSPALGNPANGGFNLCWSYDAFGNRTAQAAQSATCPSVSSPPFPTASYNSNNQVTWVQNTAPMGYSYDPSGDVTSDNTNTYLYDAEERICAVRSEPVPGTWTMTGYLYDADGTRVAKGKITNWSCDPATSGFSTTNDFILGPGGEQVTEMTMNGSGSALVWEHTNVWAAGKIIATYSQDNTGSQTQASLLHFYFDDPLGSRRVQTDFAGVVEKTCQSLPFGDGETCLPTPTEHLFTGKERDSESGNDYFGARYYGSSMARFLSPDDGSDQAPSDPQSWNLYSYVRNNPLINTDPDGNDCVLQTRTSATTETASVASTGDCSGVKVGDGQSATYVNGTVTGITAGADGHSVDIGFTSSDGSSNGVQNSASAPDANNPGLAWGYGNNAQGYNTLGAASKTVNYAAAGYWGTIGVAACAIGCPAAAATAMFNARNIYYAATGLLPVAYTAVQKLANLNISVGEANELIESPTTQRFVDNANGGNINYVADVAGKLVRITTDPAGQKIISAGIIRASSITNYLASGRFTK